MNKNLLRNLKTGDAFRLNDKEYILLNIRLGGSFYIHFTVLDIQNLETVNITEKKNDPIEVIPALSCQIITSWEKETANI